MQAAAIRPAAPQSRHVRQPFLQDMVVDCWRVTNQVSFLTRERSDFGAMSGPSSPH